jgi:hypothetical protein
MSDMNSSSNKIRMNESRRVRLVGHIAKLREKRDEYRWESQKESDCQEDLDICGRIILRWILEKKNWVAWIGLI